MVFRYKRAVLATTILLLAPAYAYVLVDSNRLQAEMDYWLCSADGETADVLLHVMADETVNESRRSNAAVGCATFNSAVQAVEAAMASHKWLPPSSNQSTPPPASEGLSATWAGCSNSSCPLSGNTAAVPLKLEIPLYIRLLEFGHEQAKDCDNAAAAVEAFVQGLVAAGCSSRACSSSDYLAARPVHGCRALVA